MLLYHSTTMRMKVIYLLLFALAPAAWSQQSKAPFTLSIVPNASWKQGQSILMARHEKKMNEYPGREFYVVLTNVSGRAQAVFETWNSWGYGNISFDLTTADGKKFKLTKGPTIFTKNGPETFLIPPDEHYVFPVWLDRTWETKPELPEIEEMPISLRAVYHVEADDKDKEDRKQNVWTGRIESKTYHLQLRQWVEREPCSAKEDPSKKEQPGGAQIKIRIGCGG